MEKRQNAVTRLKQAAVVSTVALSSGAFAVVDTTAITGELTGAAVAAAAVAAVAILIPLGIKVFKYIRTAF